MGTSLQKSYWILIALTLACAALYLWSDKAPWVADVSLSLASNLGTAIVLLVAVDHVVSREQRQEHARREAIALRQLRRLLMDHADFLARMYKATALEAPRRPLAEVSDLLDAGYFEAVR